MPLNHYVFLAMPLEEQLTTLWQEGVYLAVRHEGAHRVALHHLGSFFVEAYYSPEHNQVERLRSFVTTQGLEAYVAGLQLPEE
ncbi:hypothetical protein [Hymenobacter guriensis]|uniref:DUF3303 domain-containing protein n=1 Tax=Hymenobacter guriensis TaxID=2793065 RepID=A0ABS0KXR5_9BACT|nr:hypothetical protein [Hymenobacter guriensis]MBG8552555.1 hypothetical protein [Hymenobacter guriensis]